MEDTAYNDPVVLQSKGACEPVVLQRIKKIGTHESECDYDCA